MERRIVDVSKWQGRLNWEALLPHIDGAIIRCGYAEDNPEYDDEQFERNASECERLGIPYGVYLYSYATDTALAKSEAAHVLRLIKGKHLSYPVYFDSEERGTQGAAKACAEVFCREIEQAGYMAGVYASLSWWNNYLSGLEVSTRWIASWGPNDGIPHTPPTLTCDMWQYTSKAYIAGIRLDMSLCYRDFPKELNKEPELKPVETPPVIKEDGMTIELGNNGVTHTCDQANYGYTYEKRSDGKLVYTLSDWFGASVGKAYGNGFYTEKTLNFPHATDQNAPAFIEPPYIVGVSCRAHQNLLNVQFTSLGTDKAKFWVFGTQKDLPKFYLDVQIEGRWK